MRARRLLLPAAIGAGLVLAAPSALKRAFAPPRRASRGRPADRGLPEEEVWLDGSRDIRLHAWFVPVRGAAPAVVVLHGWGGSAADLLPLAGPLHDAGFHVLLLDARNHGLSEDDDFASLPRFADDLATAVASLRTREEVLSVGAVGHSVGAAAAILAAATGTPIDAVVAVSSFAHPGELMDANLHVPAPLRRLLLWSIERMIGYRYDEIAPRNRIAEVRVPVLLVHGDADEVVPVADSRELARRLPRARLIEVPGGTHADLEPYLPFFPEVVGFLSAHLPTGVGG